MTEETTPCPCGSGLPYAACCGPALAGAAPASTAEALMRSRYTAYVRGDMVYLEKSLWPRKRAGFDKAAARAFCADVVWTGLTVLSMRDGGPEDNTGVVEFRVGFEKAGDPREIHEVSRFRKKNGHWFYVDGDVDDGQADPAPRQATAPPVGRNAPCPCGSGKKYKRCCGA